MGTVCRKYLIILSPCYEGRRLMLSEILMPLWIKWRICSITIEKILADPPVLEVISLLVLTGPLIIRVLISVLLHIEYGKDGKLERENNNIIILLCV
jgi:hypothetical protein